MVEPPMGTCILMGDFNINYVENNDISKSSKNCLYLLNKFISTNQPLFQLVKQPTRKDRLIDLVFCTRRDVITNIQIHDPIATSDHNLIIFECLKTHDNRKMVKLPFFAKSDYDAINKFLNVGNNLNIIVTQQPKDSFENFNALLKLLIDPTFLR